MRVENVAPRRKLRVAITLSPPPKADILGAEYEGEKLLIDKKIAERCDISVGVDLTEDDLLQLVFVSECYRAKQRAVWLLSKQDYSEKTLYQKLCKVFTKKASAFAVSQMQKKGYISDERFAKRLISSCVAKNMSERQILGKLFQSGISAEISNSLLKESSDISKTELNRAVELIRSKYINKIGDENARKKTFNALMRRGFSVSDIKKALRIVTEFDCFEEENCE
jgi:regulatory protein